MGDNDIATFAIYDTLTHTTVLEKKITATPETLTFNFESEDTIDIEPDEKECGGRYRWDIVIQRNPLYDENNNLIHYDSIDSYYAAFTLPICVIKRVTRNVL